MPTTVVFLWISAAASATPPAPLALLEDFGAARGIEFKASDAQPLARPLGLPANDAATVDVIEAELEQARTALSALEEGAANARLARVEGQLLAHPHLPQAAFLMGECLALQANAARAQAPRRANLLAQRRSALEGARALSFGETEELPPLPRETLELRGLAERDELELDGAALGTTRTVELAPGPHHVRVFRHRELVFASFTEVTAEQRTLELPAPALDVCSVADLTDAANVACERWAKVRAEPAGIGVAFCERERCGAFVHWQRRAPTPFQPLRAERRGFPAWAGFAIAGAVAVASTSVLLWQSGAFDRARPGAATWQYAGVSPQGFRF